jgi:hypothetical protein
LSHVHITSNDVALTGTYSKKKLARHSLDS